LHGAQLSPARSIASYFCANNRSTAHFKAELNIIGEFGFDNWYTYMPRTEIRPFRKGINE
tara:strand:+ start:1596 stop:1775 length:180 start_codon:yes stop_codon:yes gene_type:complete